MKNKKIVHLKVHQAVSFNGALCSYFSANPIPGKQKANIEILSDLQCVLVTGGKDEVLIPFVNVASMHLESELSKERESRQEDILKTKSTSRSQDIKKPK